MSSILSTIPSRRLATTRTAFLVMLLLILGIGISLEPQVVEGFSVFTPPVCHRRSQPSHYSTTFLFQESSSSSSSNKSSGDDMDIDRDKDAKVEEFMNQGELLQDLLRPKKTCKVDQMSGTALGR
jgi:hypothetical protein